MAPVSTTVNNRSDIHFQTGAADSSQHRTVIWWLGRRLARLVSTSAAMVSEFQFGLVMLVIIFFVASQLEAALDNPVPIVLAFFLFALLGISVAHALEGTSWLSGLYQGHWSGLLLISISRDSYPGSAYQLGGNT